jgi:hypothetical protein
MHIFNTACSNRDSGTLGEGRRHKAVRGMHAQEQQARRKKTEGRREGKKGLVVKI